MAPSIGSETDLKAEIDKLRSEVEILKERLDRVEGHPEKRAPFSFGEFATRIKMFED